MLCYFLGTDVYHIVCVCIENKDHMNSEHSDAEVDGATPDVDPGSLLYP